jgi:hypothetical protein
MTRLLKRISLVGAGALAVLAMAFYGLFHGYFDHGSYEIKQFQWSSANQVAIVAERSDRDALGGPEYFVLLERHLLTPAELRHAYYSSAVVFNAASDCLTLHWEGPTRLTIACSGTTVDRNHINAQKKQIGDIEITYRNIARK